MLLINQKLSNTKSEDYETNKGVWENNRAELDYLDKKSIAWLEDPRKLQDIGYLAHTVSRIERGWAITEMFEGMQKRYGIPIQMTLVLEKSMSLTTREPHWSLS